MLLRAAFAVWLAGALALGQSSNGANPNGSPNGGMNPNGGNNSTSNSANSGTPAATMRALLRAGSSDSLHSGQNDAILGRVILNDGAEAGTGILVQRVCGSTVSAEVRTDSSGRFILSRAANNKLDADASSRGNAPTAWGCELRASLDGYLPASLPVGNGRTDGGEVLILLHRVPGLHDMTVSAANLLAPKDARRAYEKGLDAARRSLPDRAQQAFLDAVRIYPRYPAAWLELGKVYEQRGHRAEARDAYAKAIAADSEYLFPYERLYRMDIRESRWQEAADASTKILRLDPYEFPQAYYFNAVANLELNRLDQAERSAREAAKLEGAQADPRGNYVLGLVLFRKGDLDGAGEKLDAFLETSPSGAELASTRRLLAVIQQRKKAREEQPRQAASSPADAPGDR